MHVKEKSSWIKHLDFIILDLISVIVAFSLSYYIKFGNLRFMSSEPWRIAVVVLLLGNMVVILIMNPFSGILKRPYYEDAVKLALFSIYGFIIVSILFYVMKVGALYSRTTIILFFVYFYFIDFTLTYIRKKMLLSGMVKGFVNRNRRLLLIANYKDIEETEKNILAGDMTLFEIAGYCFIDDLYNEKDYKDKPVIDIEHVAESVITKHIDDVFIAADPTVLSPADYKKIADNGVTIDLNIESMTGIEGDDQFISNVGVYKAASIGPYSFDSKHVVYFVVKRVFDFIIGLIGCLFLLILFVIIKLSYVLSGDRAPIIYSQIRVGQYGKLFKLYKFRTMVPDADEILKSLLQNEEYRRQWEENQKLDNDPRITKIGKLLRRTSLDEIPQLVNVVKGEMSLIGPRPLIPGELTDHDGLTLYNRVKPGITGWWACNGRSSINYRERLELEYYYVKNCSLYLDLLCIMRTVIAVVKKKGAQ